MSALVPIQDPETGDRYWIDADATEEGAATICRTPAKTVAWVDARLVMIDGPDPAPSALRLPGWLVGLAVGLCVGAAVMRGMM